MMKTVQKTLHCPCGRQKVIALGLCASCYNLKRQDEEYFGGLREQVLERDEHRCRGCGASGRDKGSIVVHHRTPGKSLLHLMISLCPACHAKVHRTKAVLSLMSPLLPTATAIANDAGRLWVYASTVIEWISMADGPHMRIDDV